MGHKDMINLEDLRGTHLKSHPFFCFCFVLKRGSYVAQAGPKFTEEEEDDFECLILLPLTPEWWAGLQGCVPPSMVHVTLWMEPGTSAC